MKLLSILCLATAALAAPRPICFGVDCPEGGHLTRHHLAVVAVAAAFASLPAGAGPYAAFAAEVGEADEEAEGEGEGEECAKEEKGEEGAEEEKGEECAEAEKGEEGAEGLVKRNLKGGLNHFLCRLLANRKDCPSKHSPPA